MLTRVGSRPGGCHWDPCVLSQLLTLLVSCKYTWVIAWLEVCLVDGLAIGLHFYPVLVTGLAGQLVGACLTGRLPIGACRPMIGGLIEYVIVSVSSGFHKMHLFKVAHSTCRGLHGLLGRLLG